MSPKTKLTKILRILRDLDPKKRLNRTDKQFVVRLLERGLV